MSNKGKGKEKDTFTVEKILDKRTKKGIVEYKVKWQGYSLSESTWEPLKHLVNVKGMVLAFDKKQSSDDSVSVETVESSPPRQSKKQKKVAKLTVKERKESSEKSQEKTQKSSKVDKKAKEKEVEESDNQEDEASEKISQRMRPSKRIVPQQQKKTPSTKRGRKQSTSDSNSPKKKGIKPITLKKKQVESSVSEEKNQEKVVEEEPIAKSNSTSRDRKSKSKPAGEEETKYGCFEQGDKVNEIVNIRKDGSAYRVEFLVNWKPRKNGTKPQPSWILDWDMKKNAPAILCEYLFTKIKWPL